MFQNKYHSLEKLELFSPLPRPRVPESFEELMEIQMRRKEAYLERDTTGENAGGCHAGCGLFLPAWLTLHVTRLLGTETSIKALLKPPAAKYM